MTFTWRRREWEGGLFIVLFRKWYSYTVLTSLKEKHQEPSPD
jgi:hypothetical protein